MLRIDVQSWKRQDPVVVQFWQEIATKAGGEASLEMLWRTLFQSLMCLRQTTICGQLLVNNIPLLTLER